MSLTMDCRHRLRISLITVKKAAEIENTIDLFITAFEKRFCGEDVLISGHLLVSLFELFGESILSFIPSPEMSLFL
ncbi:hypothetical protein SADUNF_Sadunf14G0122800 [Salix dunnii]|uniref:Uncharacterized protein n=1 Tax=Salix dunnii TaxID=1413687 RepID=A0A835JFB6_9ROSI|nr:hypothetical protein SADUNF_Sadunf14G0122800 [Salix dunnii]